MQGIEELDDGFYEYEASQKKRKARERREELAEKEKRTAYKAREAKLLPKKIELYEKIIAWRDEFSKTEQFKKVFRVLEQTIIFNNGWASSEGNNFGGWSRLLLERNGRLTYEEGYKWIGVRSSFELTSNAEKESPFFSHKYLSELYDSIKSGEVYHTIAAELKEENKY